MKPEQFYCCVGYDRYVPIEETKIQCKHDCIRENAYGEVVICGNLRIKCLHTEDFAHVDTFESNRGS